jgi:heme A synthase
VLSIGLWAAAALTLVKALVRGLPWERAGLLFALLTLEGVLGVASLQPGQPLVLSIVHQACAIAVLVAALAPRDWWAQPLVQTSAVLGQHRRHRS